MKAFSFLLIIVRMVCVVNLQFIEFDLDKVRPEQHDFEKKIVFLLMV